jgi:hypothetical protein
LGLDKTHSSCRNDGEQATAVPVHFWSGLTAHTVLFLMVLDFCGVCISQPCIAWMVATHNLKSIYKVFILFTFKTSKKLILTIYINKTDDQFIGLA